MNPTETELPFPAFAESEQEAGYKIFLTIRDRLRQEGRLTPDEEERLLKQAAEAQLRYREWENRAR
ncbi:MAG: hypothetical protein ACREXU_01620 [Gammaproteobacteria bacterium]